jgi:hypothetical protein
VQINEFFSLNPEEPTLLWKSTLDFSDFNVGPEFGFFTLIFTSVAIP